MIVTCNKNQLSEALQEIIHVVSSSTMIPVLNHVLLRITKDSMELTGSDLEISLLSRISCVAEEELQAAVPAKLFADIIKSMTEEELSLDFQENNLQIVGQHNTFALNCMDAAEFPALPQVQGASYTINGQAMVNLFRKVHAAISAKGEGNPSFSSVLLQTFANELRMVTTDGQRLMIAKHWETTDLNSLHILVPPKALGVLTKILGKSTENVTLVAGEREISVLCQQKTLISRVFEGTFPDYDRVIPSSVSFKFELNTHDFLVSLQRLNLLVRNTSKRITFQATEDKLLLTANDPEVGSGREALGMTTTGGEFEAVFDVKKLMDGVECIESDELVIETAGPLHPLIIKEKDSDNYLYLLVSLRKP